MVAPVTRPAVAPKETGGSPEFPVYPFKHMPRSQTPVVSRSLAMTRAGLLPSRSSTLSAFRPVARPYPLSATIHFSEFNDAACVLAFPLLRTLPFSSRTSVRLRTGWLESLTRNSCCEQVKFAAEANGSRILRPPLCVGSAFRREKTAPAIFLSEARTNKRRRCLQTLPVV